jgi:uncharacterized membrane protein YtjA (UPF0391 family)
VAGSGSVLEMAMAGVCGFGGCSGERAKIWLLFFLFWFFFKKFIKRLS